jgi:hypothetical protein
MTGALVQCGLRVGRVGQTRARDPRALRAPLLALALGWLLCTGTAVGADHAEILYVIEVDAARLTADAGSDGAPSFTPATLAATLAGAVTIDVHLFEPVAAIPYPSIVIAGIDADGEPVGRHRLEYGTDYAAAGEYRFGLPPGTADTLAAMLAERGSSPDGSERRLQLAAIEDLGYQSAEARIESAVSEPARLLDGQQGRDGAAANFAISIVAVPRTVETFVADAGKGGGVTFMLRYEAPQH